MEDPCGVCIDPEDDGFGQSCAGCDGIPNSGTMFDSCGICGGGNQTCSGCDGNPNSGLSFDACGVCGGDNSTCNGCDGVPFSGLIFDECGDCLHPSDPGESERKSRPSLWRYRENC